MCGIFGWWRRDGAEALSEAEVRRATEPMRRRGPDDFGCHRSASGFAMGFRRLSIIDLDTGHQPQTNEDRTVHATSNGEIYNFRELRERLQGLGHTFASQSDTEVIVHGYEEWGDEVFDRLCGMFAIALWDESRRRMVLARDRLGIKPLYYMETPRVFAYASDPRCLLAVGGTSPELDPDALALYLKYLNVPAPWSIYRGIRKFLPGEMRTVTADASRERRYWNLALAPDGDDETGRVDRFADLFQEVVSQHLIADVPLGAFLSGGMDSTAVIQAAVEDRREPLLSFNVAFADPDHDESAYARQAAAELGTRHLVLEMDSDPGDAIGDALEAFPEPFGDTAAVPNYLLSRTIRRHCTVALSGDGGDEVFGGYSLRTAQMLMALQKTPRSLRRLLASAPGAPEALALSLRDPVDWYLRFHSKNSDENVSRLAGESAAGALDDRADQMRDHLRHSRVEGTLNPMLFLDLAYGLPDQMLTKVDATSMAHSLEVRVPFLDHRVVEFAGALPESLKQKGYGSRRTKRLIRSYLARRFPASFIDRPKQGFGMPISGPLHDRLRSDGAGAPLPLPPQIDEVSLQTLRGSPNFSARTAWGIVALSEWWTRVGREALGGS